MHQADLLKLLANGGISFYKHTPEKSNMVSVETLEKHIARKIEQGAPKKDILKQLTNAGWPEDVIQQYISKFEKNEVQLSFLKLEGVTKSFDANLVLDRADLTIQSGEILGIIGESGSGKSTLLHTMVGFIEPDAGDVILTLKDQQPVSVIKHPESIKKLVGFSTQNTSFYGKLSVKENVSYFASLNELSGVELTEQSNSLLALTGLKEFKNVISQTLSGNLQKRLDIACSLVNNPKILVLDEPTADLDPVSAKNLLQLIKQINEQGTTIIIASHILEDVEQVCTRIAVLRDKKIMETGSPDELRNIYSQNYQIIIETVHQNYVKLAKLLKGQKSKTVSNALKNEQLVITTSAPEQILARLPILIHHCNDKLKSVSLNKPGLRDVFEMLVQKSGDKNKK